MQIFTEKPLVDFIEKHPKMRVAIQDWTNGAIGICGDYDGR